MRVLLIWPKFESFSFWNFERTCRLVGAKYMTPPLGLLTVAALLPRDWELRVVDENVTPLREADIRWANLVIVSAKIVHRARAIAVISWTRQLGVPVAVGGPDPTMSPHVYNQLGIDYLCLGEAEGIVPELVQDIRAGVRGKTYRFEGQADITTTPVPRFDLVKLNEYLYVGVQFSRGCPHHCEFCNVIDLFSNVYRTKTTAQVLQEFECLYRLGYRGHVDFFDDNLVGKVVRAKELLRGIAAWLKEHNYPFFCSTSLTLNIAKDDELLDLLREARFKYFLVGIETPDQNALRAAQKPQNLGFSIAEATDRIYRRAGATVHSGFLLGMDGESDHIAEDIIHCIDEACVPWVMAGVVYPLPGTQLARRLDREGRLFPAVRRDMPEGARDQISAGIQFRTERPPLAVLDDLIRVMHHSFDPAGYFDRCRRVAIRLNTLPNLAPGLRLFFRNIRTFFRLLGAMATLRGARWPFLRGLAHTMLRNFRGIEAYVTLSVLYVHFAGMLEYCFTQLDKQRAELVELGEDGWLRKNLPMDAPKATPVADAALEVREAVADVVQLRLHGGAA